MRKTKKLNLKINSCKQIQLVLINKKEVEKLQNLVSNVEQFINLKQYSKSNSSQKEKQTFNDVSQIVDLLYVQSILTVSLKKQIKDLKKKLTLKDEELKKNQMEVKYTKLEELRIEIDESQQESMRLKTLLEQSMRNQAIVQMTQDFNSMEEKFFVQMQLINQLKQENEYISGLLRFQEEQCFRLDNEQELNRKIIKQKDQELQELKQKFTEKTNELNSIISKFTTVRNINQDLQNKNTKLDGNQQTIQLQGQILQSLEKQINEKDLNIQYMDKTNSELKQKLADTQANEVRQKKTLQDEVHKWQQMYDELEEKYKNTLINQQSRMKETLVSMGTNLRQVVKNLLYYFQDASLRRRIQQIIIKENNQLVE